MNKKFLYIIFLYIVIQIFFITYVNAQKIKAGVAAGLNFTMVDGDEVYGYHKVGLNSGPFVVIPLAENFSLNIETIYNEKGSHQRALSDDSLNGAYHLELNYLEVPVFLQYHDKGGGNIGTGFSWGRLVNFSESEHERKIEWTKSTFPYLRDDWNWFADVSVNLKGGFKLNLRYFYTLIPIRTRTFKTGETRKQYNTGFTFRLLYVINEQQASKAK